MQRLITWSIIVLIAGCGRSTITEKNSSLEGTWLLVYSGKQDSDFWTNPNQVPLGFRIYSSDSAEVYRNNYRIFRERYTSVHTANQSLEFFESDSLGWWKRNYIQNHDTLTIIYENDTLRYLRLFANKPVVKESFDKIILVSGGGWGELLTAVLYPDGKVVLYAAGHMRDPWKEFCILHAKPQFAQLAGSVYWINRIRQHEAFDEFRRQFDMGVVMDGAFSEMAFLADDSVFMSESHQQYSDQNHLLGLHGFALASILGKKYNRIQEWPSLISACDSTRKILVPVCGYMNIVNHLSTSMLISESMNRPVPDPEDVNRHLNVVLRSRCMPEQSSIYTDGRIVSTDMHTFYDTGCDFLSLVQKY